MSYPFTKITSKVFYHRCKYRDLYEYQLREYGTIDTRSAANAAHTSHRAFPNDTFIPRVTLYTLYVLIDSVCWIRAVVMAPPISSIKDATTLETKATVKVALCRTSPAKKVKPVATDPMKMK